METSQDITYGGHVMILPSLMQPLEKAGGTKLLVQHFPPVRGKLCECKTMF